MSRAHGTGTLVKRGNIYTARWMSKGKLYTRSTGCSNERDARKKLEEFTKPFRENTDIEVYENLAAKVRVAEKATKTTKNKEIPPIKLMFLVDVLKKDVNSSSIRAGTEAMYDSIVNVFKKFTNLEYAYEVTPKHVEDFLKAQKERVGISRYNAMLARLRQLFTKAMQFDYRIRTNPFENFKKLNNDKSQRRRELTDDEVKLLLKTANEIDPNLGLLFDIAVYTGLRRSDCLNLKWSNIDMEKKMITVLPKKTMKNGIEAKIPIHPKLYERLKTLPHQSQMQFVVPTYSVQSITTVKHIINQVFVKAGIETSVKDENGKTKVTTGFHALRHYFISQCVKNGIPVSVVQKMVAHSSADMSLAYTHVFDSDLRLPDYDNETDKVILKKTTIAALNKAKGILDLDEFLMKLLEGKPVTIHHVKTKQDIELDNAIDEMFADEN